MSTDLFTHQIIAAALEAAADEMFDILRRTAMSPIIYEVLDVGTGILDAEGRLISSGAGIPSFIGVLDKSVTAILQKHSSHIEPGDIFITNDPDSGGVTHLNDIVVVQPIFAQNILIAWVASIAHWGDIGGKVPGSMPVDVSDIFGEGLRLPNIKLASNGTLNASVLDIIKVNSRLPDFIEGDLRAQMAAGQKAAQLIKRLYDRYGAQAFSSAIQRAYKQARARMRRGLAQLPKGTFSIFEPQDDGQVLRAFITIRNDLFEIDLRENPDQMAAPHNTSRDGTLIACQMFFKALTDPIRAANAGSFVILKVHTKPGTIFHATDNAPHGYYFETRIRLFDMLWRCLAQQMPERLPAGHFASIFGTVIAGQHPDTHRPYTMVEPQMGGWGATAERAGMSAMFSTSHGDTFNCPVEIAEARYGYEVVEKALRSGLDECEDAHTIGSCFKGGKGVRTVYQLRNKASLSVGMSHAQIPVWSIGHAPKGGHNALTIVPPDGDKVRYNYASGLELELGTQIVIETANGGNVKR